MTEKSSMQVLAERLRAQLALRRVTPTQFARECGLSEGTMRLLLNPDRRQPGAGGRGNSPQLATIEAVARQLGLSVADLILKDPDQDPFTAMSLPALRLAQEFDAFTGPEKKALFAQLRGLIQRASSGTPPPQPAPSAAPAQDPQTPHAAPRADT